MPKEGPSKAEWRKRLDDYANGNFSFGKGQRPGKGSRWEKEIEKIDCCPRKSATKTNLFRMPVKCTCGYHVAKVNIVCTEFIISLMQCEVWFP